MWTDGSCPSERLRRKTQQFCTAARRALGAKLESSAGVGRRRLWDSEAFRRSALVRLSAICLVILAACPLTAPFSIFDAAHTAQSKHCPDVAQKVKPPIVHSILTVTTFQIIAVTSDVAHTRHPMTAAFLRFGSNQHFVLRT